MTPIEELNKAIDEFIEIKKRAEERYQEALFYLHKFKDIERFRDTHTNEVIVIGQILGYAPEKITDDIHMATGDKDELQLINKNGVFYADSRQVAVMIDKRHDHLLRDIERYREYLTRLKIDCNNYFIKSSYKIKGNNKTYPCYLISKMGCEFIENKMTGKRGALFTFKYLQRNGEK